tara:strand:+ start:307 stop:567 length:261 start_codon:yes stop_codon:yes gene_type:complete
MSEPIEWPQGVADGTVWINPKNLVPWFYNEAENSWTEVNFLPLVKPLFDKVKDLTQRVTELEQQQRKLRKAERARVLAAQEQEQPN